MEGFSIGPHDRFDITMNFIFVLFVFFIHFNFIQVLKYLLILLVYTLLASSNVAY